MYLHIGKNCVINDKDIIGIFNIKNINNEEFKKIYDNLKENNKLFILSNQHKSFVLTQEKGYISNISASIINKHRI